MRMPRPIRMPDHAKQRTMAGYVALALALVSCPCHLPLTLGIAAALLGGGTIAAALSENAAVFAAAALVFVGSLGLAYRLLWARPAPAARAPTRA